MNKRLIGGIIGAVLAIIIFIIINPISHNEAGYRTVVQTPSGEIWVRYDNGLFLHMPFSILTRYPDIITIAYKNTDVEGTINAGTVGIRFNDATTADAEIMVRYRLPMVEAEMVAIHKQYRSQQGLAQKGLAPYTVECVKSAAQLMESETHYSGGRSQLSEDFRNQLSNGQYLIDIKEDMIKDTATGESKRIYHNKVRMGENGLPLRVKSDIVALGITIADAVIEEVDYAKQVDEKLAKKIEASTRESVSKQNLITAQQEELTAAAEGRKRLVEIEYEQKQQQTKEVVQAETQVKLAEKDKEKQKIALEASRLEAAKIKELADAEAYAKGRIMAADGALEKKLDAYKYAQAVWADAWAKNGAAIVPTIQGGNGSGGNALDQFLNLQNMKTAKDLGIDMGMKK